jgi:hypothetical protein
MNKDFFPALFFHVRSRLYGAPFRDANDIILIEAGQFWLAMTCMSEGRPGA